MFSTSLMPNVGKVQMTILAISRFWKKWKKLEELLEETKTFKSATFKTVSKFGRNGRKCYILLIISNL